MTRLEAAERQRWRPGSRVGRLRASHSYRPVLLLVFAVFAFVSASPDAAWARTVLTLGLCLLLLLALWTSGVTRDYRLGTALVVVVAAAAVAALVNGGSALQGTLGLVDFALAVAATVAIGIGVIDQGEVNRQSVLGAICIYVLLGLLFTFIYGAVALLQSGPFFAQGTDGTASIRLYFSYVTLATLGYGDYTPRTDLGHTLAVLETLFGQLYLVTILALLVSNLGRKRGSDPSGS